MKTILPWNGVWPAIDPSAFIADQTTLTGDITVGPDASIWFGSVLRGDVHRIRIGARSNIQDLSILHGNYGRFEVVVGEDVTVGHRVTLHGCHVGDRCLIGMGSIILDGARIGSEVIVAAGAVVPPGMEVPDGVLVMGSPAKIKRPVTDEERARFREVAARYVEFAQTYRAMQAQPPVR